MAAGSGAGCWAATRTQKSAPKPAIRFIVGIVYRIARDRIETTRVYCRRIFRTIDELLHPVDDSAVSQLGLVRCHALAGTPHVAYQRARATLQLLRLLTIEFDVETKLDVRWARW